MTKCNTSLTNHTQTFWFSFDLLAIVLIWTLMLTLSLFHIPKMWFQLFLDLLLLCFCASACTWFVQVWVHSLIYVWKWEIYDYCGFFVVVCELSCELGQVLRLCICSGTFGMTLWAMCAFIWLISNFFINASHIWTSFIVSFSIFAALCICAHNSLITNDSGSVC